MIYVDIAITKMSSKGQIVIPQEMRKDIKEGEKLILLKDKERIVVKKANKLDKQLEEDLEFARRTEEALKRYGHGGFKSMDSEDFLKELEKW